MDSKTTFFKPTALVVALTLFLGGVFSPAEAQAEKKRAFVHPGLLHTEESLAMMRRNIAKKVEPNFETWNRLLTNWCSGKTGNPRVQNSIKRPGNSDIFRQDVRWAYQIALIWRIGGDEKYGEYGRTACKVLNAWARQKPELVGNGGHEFLVSGIYGYELVNAAELVRDHPDFDKVAMDKWLLAVFYPACNYFIHHHYNSQPGNHWAAWDLCNIAALVAIGIFTDRPDIYEMAVDYYKTGLGMGTLYNSVPYVYKGGLAQWQEAGRDQGHATLGSSFAGPVCEMAWSQGDDLYSLSDNRFLKGAEYVARYNNFDDVPYSEYWWWCGNVNPRIIPQKEVSPGGRGHVRPVYSLVYNHYVNRMGLKAPNIEKTLKNKDDSWKLEMESVTFDELGWQTLTFAKIGKPAKPKKTNGVFPNGIYRICSTHTGRALASAKTGVISTATKGLNPAEWWKFTNTGDGEYSIRNTVTGQFLEPGEKTYKHEEEYKTGGGMKDSQRFAIIPNADGSYRVISAINSFAMVLKGNSREPDARIVQWPYREDVGQKWTIEPKSKATIQ